MNDRLDKILKMILAGAILITLILINLPEREESTKERSSRTPSEKSDQTQPTSNTSASAQAVNAYTASMGTVTHYIKVNGDMITQVEIEIYPEISGKLVNQNYGVGDYIKKGSVVAIVDPSSPGKIFAQSAVYSTISGTILSINAQIGDRVSSNTPILTVGDLSQLQLQTFVPEKYIGNLKLGLRADVTFAAYPTEIFSARITELSPVIDPLSRTMEIKMELSEEDNRIKAGMFGAIRLITEQAENVVAIPADALFTHYGEDTVYVISDENNAEKRTVVLGLSTVDMVEVTQGLEAGETVVTQGQSLLSDGSAVRIVE